MNEGGKTVGWSKRNFPETLRSQNPSEPDGQPAAGDEGHGGIPGDAGASPAWVDNVEMSCWQGTRGAEWMWWLRTRAQVKGARGKK